MEMTSYDNDKILDTYEENSELATDHNHKYVDIQTFGLENAPYLYYTNEWDGFVGDLDFDETLASASHATPQKGISVEHLSKVWRIDLQSA